MSSIASLQSARNITNQKDSKFRYIDTIEHLRNSAPISRDSAWVVVGGYYEPGDSGGGEFIRDLDDTTSSDNSGTIIVSNGIRWKRRTGPIIDPRWFGAKPNDSTFDNSTVLNNTIRWVVNNMQDEGNTNLGGVVIDLGGRIYYCNAPVIGPPSYGANNLTIQNGMLKAMETFTQPTRGLLEFRRTGAPNFTRLHLHRLTIHCNGVVDMGIRFNGVASPKVAFCHIRNFNSRGIEILGDADAPQILTCHINSRDWDASQNTNVGDENLVATGVYTETPDGMVADCKIFSCHTGIYQGEGGAQFSIVRNHIYQCVRGIYVYGTTAGTTVNRVNITNNFIDGCPIYSHRAWLLNISNNIFLQNYSAAIMLMAPSGWGGAPMPIAGTTVIGNTTGVGGVNNVTENDTFTLANITASTTDTTATFGPNIPLSLRWLGVVVRAGNSWGFITGNINKVDNTCSFRVMASFLSSPLVAGDWEFVTGEIICDNSCRIAKGTSIFANNVGNSVLHQDKGVIGVGRGIDDNVYFRHYREDGLLDEVRLTENSYQIRFNETTRLTLNTNGLTIGNYNSGAGNYAMKTANNGLQVTGTSVIKQLSDTTDQTTIKFRNAADNATWGSLGYSVNDGGRLNFTSTSGRYLFTGIPSSSAGLPQGAIWYDPADSNTLKYVP